MTLEEITLEILAERALFQADSKKLVYWAISVLELGYDSENLYILAGLDHEGTEEREEYFWRSIIFQNTKFSSDVFVMFFHFHKTLVGLLSF